MSDGAAPGAVAVAAVFETVRERLALRRVAGRDGESRLIEAGEREQRRPSLVGYLNVIYPNRIQVIGTEELRYLDALDARPRWEAIARIIAYRPAAIIVTRDQNVPADLRESAEEASIPLWVSARRGHEVVTYLSYHLARALARRVTLHGVFMEVYSIGVLIAGDSGVGKSELALELLTRGHRLIADDAPEFTQIAPDVLDGTCPELLRNLLEVRGLGVLDVREMFGDTAVKQNKYLRLIIELTGPEQLHAQTGLERLEGVQGRRTILDVDIPVVTIPVALGRNLAVLVEAAVRSHLLHSKGIDPAQTFMDRQAHQMRKHSPFGD